MKVLVLKNILFLCTGNSARSILAEAILNRMGAGRFRAYSAGSQPKDEPHPAALALLKRLGHPVEGFASKSWDVFAGEGAPEFQHIITVCDNAAGEACPVWLGKPNVSHWGIPDPASIQGSDLQVENAFLSTYALLSDRIGCFVAAPSENMDAADVAARMAAIGHLPGMTAGRAS